MQSALDMKERKITEQKKELDTTNNDRSFKKPPATPLKSPAKMITQKLSTPTPAKESATLKTS
jgi:hypothetical protein